MSGFELCSSDKYTKIEAAKKIGIGGSSVVYRGKDLTTDSYVVIKVIEGGASDPMTLNFAMKEVEKIRSLLHPCIPSVLDVFETMNDSLGVHDLCIVFQDEGGIPLSVKMSQNSRNCEASRGMRALEPSDVANTVTQLITVVDYVHDRKISHRDIKPENLLLLEDGRLKLIDFGSSISIHSTTNGGRMTGTDEFMAPEALLRGVEIMSLDPLKLDVWAIGATLLNCICGAFLIDRRRDSFIADKTALIAGGDDWSVDIALERHFEEFPQAKALWETASESVKAIIYQCMRHNPIDRPTVAAIAQSEVYIQLKNDILVDKLQQRLVQSDWTLKAIEAKYTAELETRSGLHTELEATLCRAIDSEEKLRVVESALQQRDSDLKELQAKLDDSQMRCEQAEARICELEEQLKGLGPKLNNRSGLQDTSTSSVAEAVGAPSPQMLPKTRKHHPGIYRWYFADRHYDYRWDCCGSKDKQDPGCK
jgi:serine/threonine protein kinase